METENGYESIYKNLAEDYYESDGYGSNLMNMLLNNQEYINTYITEVETYRRSLTEDQEDLDNAINSLTHYFKEYLEKFTPLDKAIRKENWNATDLVIMYSDLIDDASTIGHQTARNNIDAAITMLQAKTFPSCPGISEKAEAKVREYLFLLSEFVIEMVFWNNEIETLTTH